MGNYLKMSKVYMIRRKTDGEYICGTSRYPWFSKEAGKIFYSLNSVKMFLTSYMRYNKIKVWTKGRYKFNAGEFFTPSNMLMNCEIIGVELKPTQTDALDVFDYSAEQEMKKQSKPKKEKKVVPNG